ncbi:hypothetical protein BRPE64_ACDS01140 [Caballeronia insecticola]|uniref:Uncharacterized protein n=1 Tax=Caballeronia insecticola TaxID=758793 RepID=R4WEN5_9BURK|nr:hypothetical protein BRPE64_ACDS01140 [Caballeronia insecticola]
MPSRKPSKAEVEEVFMAASLPATAARANQPNGIDGAARTFRYADAIQK